MKTLLTGATGFLGSNLLSALHKSSELHVVSRNTIKAKPDGVIEHVGDLKNVEFIHELANLGFDRLLHCAWEGLPSRAPEVNLVNSEVSKNIFSIFSQINAIEITGFGSCLEYGNLVGEVSELEVPNYLDDFGATKQDLLVYLQKLDVPFRWIRLFYLYGKGQHQKALIPSMLNSILSKNAIQINNAGAAHDFIYIKDAASAIIELMQSPKGFGVFNLGSGVSATVGHIAEYILEITKSPTQFFNFEEPSNPLTASTDKLSNATGWKPTFTIKEGIRDFLLEFDRENTKPSQN